MKLPGVMAMLVAAVVVQFSVLLEPDVILVGRAVNELIVGFGLLIAFMVTVKVDVAEPALLVAVSV
jgi:hypothetical protein